MKKAELLRHVPARLPKGPKAKQIKADGQKALMLIIPKDIAGERVIHFSWKEGWLTYHIDRGYWSRQSLAWIEGGYNYIKLARKELDEIEKYMGRKCYGTGAIVNYEENITWHKRRIAEDKKQKQIDTFMQKVPALPNGFMQWARSEIRKRRSDGRVVSIQLIQKMQTMYVERLFRVTGKGEDQTITEICRGITGEPGGAWHAWYYGERLGAVGKAQSFWDRKNGSVVNVLPKRFILYDRNLEELGLPKAVISSLRAMRKQETDYTAMIRRLKENPELEKVIKLGLVRMADDMVNSFEVVAGIDKLKRLTRQQVEMLIRHNGGLKMAEFLLTGTRISQENAAKISLIKSDDKMCHLIHIAQRGLNINHVITLMEKTGGLKTDALRKYMDYLDMAETQNMDIHDEIVYRNKRWMEFHDRYVEDLNRIRRERQMQRREEQVKGYGDERFAGIQNDFQRNTDLFGWQQDGFCIVVPASYMDIMEEGRKQHHCVGASDHYMENMSARRTFIVFLRRQEEPEKPYYTIETDGSRILQFYAEFDRQPDKEAVKKILDKWIGDVRKRKESLQAAG